MYDKDILMKYMMEIDEIHDKDIIMKYMIKKYRKCGILPF